MMGVANQQQLAARNCAEILRHTILKRVYQNYCQFRLLLHGQRGN